MLYLSFVIVCNFNNYYVFAAPPRPSSQVVPTEVCRTSTTIQIRFRKNYFSDVNGGVSFFTVLGCLVVLKSL